MYTNEEIEKAKKYLDNKGYGTGSNFTLNAVANLMVEYAKNCSIPAASNRCFCGAVWDGVTCNQCGFDASEVDIY